MPVESFSVAYTIKCSMFDVQHRGSTGEWNHKEGGGVILVFTESGMCHHCRHISQDGTLGERLLLKPTPWKCTLDLVRYYYILLHLLIYYYYMLQHVPRNNGGKDETVVFAHTRFCGHVFSGHKALTRPYLALPLICRPASGGACSHLNSTMPGKGNF